MAEAEIGGWHEKVVMLHLEISRKVIPLVEVLISRSARGRNHCT